MDLPAPVERPVVRPTHLDQNKLAELAYELARDLKERPDIFRSYGITQEQFERFIENQEWFKRVLEAAMIEWVSTGSTKTRIKMQAALALETGIVPLARRMLQEDEDLNKRVEVAKLLAKLAGIDNTIATGSNPGEKFTITINLGADQIKVETDATPGPAPLEASAGPGEVFQITEGTGNKTPVQQLDQGGGG